MEEFFFLLQLKHLKFILQISPKISLRRHGCFASVLPAIPPFLIKSSFPSHSRALQIAVRYQRILPPLDGPIIINPSDDSPLPLEPLAPIASRSQRAASVTPPRQLSNSSRSPPQAPNHEERFCFLTHHIRLARQSPLAPSPPRFTN